MQAELDSVMACGDQASFCELCARATRQQLDSIVERIAQAKCLQELFPWIECVQDTLYEAAIPLVRRMRHLWTQMDMAVPLDHHTVMRAIRVLGKQNQLSGTTNSGRLSWEQELLPSMLLFDQTRDEWTEMLALIDQFQLQHSVWPWLQDWVIFGHLDPVDLTLAKMAAEARLSPDGVQANMLRTYLPKLLCLGRLQDDMVKLIIDRAIDVGVWTSAIRQDTLVWACTSDSAEPLVIRLLDEGIHFETVWTFSLDCFDWHLKKVLAMTNLAQQLYRPETAAQRRSDEFCHYELRTANLWRRLELVALVE